MLTDTAQTMSHVSQAKSSEAQDDDHLSIVAQKYWAKSTAKKANPDVIKAQLWDHLERENFAAEQVSLLEHLQCLERYLWPTFDEDATNYHVLLIVILVNSKRRQGLPTWTLLQEPSPRFAALFRRILELALDSSLAITIRTHLLVCIVGAFQSLENGLIRKECAPLVSISIWHNLHSDSIIKTTLDNNPQFKKAWRLTERRYENADEAGKIRIQFERSWLYTLLLDFLDMLYSPNHQTVSSRLYCERFLELLCDLESQFPTRRYVNKLLRDLNVLVIAKHSPMLNSENGSLARSLFALLEHYMDFPLDDHTGRLLSQQEVNNALSREVSFLQRIALRHFKGQLDLLALANHGSMRQPEELKSHLDSLNDEDLIRLSNHLGIRTDYGGIPSLVNDRRFTLQTMTCRFEQRSDYKSEMKKLSVLPTENLLYDPSFQTDDQYDGQHPLALPKLNLQYLATADFMWRSFILYRKEAFWSLRLHVEEHVKRTMPKRDQSAAQLRPQGSPMVCRIIKTAIVNVAPPDVGEESSAEIRAEIILDTSNLSDNVRREWEGLRNEDVVFLVMSRKQRSKLLTNGDAPHADTDQAPYLRLRSAEVVQVLDERGHPVRFMETQENGLSRRPRQRRLIVHLDPGAYATDIANQQKGLGDIYESMDLVVRRRSRENNFKPVLESIRKLALLDSPLPPWLSDVFLGLGDPSGASYKNLSTALKTLDFRDTFLSWSHLREALPEKDVQPDNGAEEISNPPYVLESANGQDDAAEPSKKRIKQDDSKSQATRQNSEQILDGGAVASKAAKVSKKRRRQDVEQEPVHETVRVSTYKPPNMGPYISDVVKPNQVRFTPAQVEAITSGTQPGLTVIVGPPGTGKTDVAVQIINNIYHNFQNERILLVAHSNQALNQLFAKIVALDIDERHLLRLGQGERDLQLESESSYSKQGRVENFLEHGARLLMEVNRLAISIRAPGAHGNSCETAEYFNTVYVQPVWKQYLEKVADAENTTEIVDHFPFHEFFYNAPQPLFPEGCTREQALDVVTGCYRHIEKIFIELQDIQPFEVLRREREKANYLLVKEARIVAMTTTHAAMRRQEIANLGFQYDNVIMEEAAQITEVENFIPLVMQKPQSGTSEHNLKRVVLCGDHLQNSPIISNYAYRDFANLEQSMFLRLIRLGVPYTLLDKQGRARETIAELYKWRYPAMGSLPHVLSSPEFQVGNAGLRHDYQFIDVPDYKGKGESQPVPHYIQNLGEAEYAVALYQYMRLLGYPARSISILTMYAGQRSLIRDVLAHRCKGNRLFGLPRTVSTVDKYQGEQNDCEYKVSRLK